MKPIHVVTTVHMRHVTVVQGAVGMDLMEVRFETRTGPEEPSELSHWFRLSPEALRALESGIAVKSAEPTREMPEGWQDR